MSPNRNDRNFAKIKYIFRLAIIWIALLFLNLMHFLETVLFCSPKVYLKLTMLMKFSCGFANGILCRILLINLLILHNYFPIRTGFGFCCLSWLDQSFRKDLWMCKIIIIIGPNGINRFLFLIFFSRWRRVRNY